MAGGLVIDRLFARLGEERSPPLSAAGGQSRAHRMALFRKSGGTRSAPAVALPDGDKHPLDEPLFRLRSRSTLVAAVLTQPSGCASAPRSPVPPSRRRERQESEQGRPSGESPPETMRSPTRGASAPRWLGRAFARPPEAGARDTRLEQAIAGQPVIGARPIFRRCIRSRACGDGTSPARNHATPLARLRGL